MNGAVLAFEASSLRPSVALLDDDGRPLGRWMQAEGLRGTHRLAPEAAALLAAHGLTPGDLLGVAVGTGPGSYTGLRSAIALARGLAHASARPVVGIPSVEAAARAVLVERPAIQRVVVLLDARRDELYRADYARGVGDAPDVVSPPRLVSASTGEPSPHADLAIVREPVPDAYHVAALGRERLAAGGTDPATIRPLYLKRSHAEIALDERKSRLK